MSKKYKVEIEETVKLNHTLTVVVEDGVDLDGALDQLENEGNHPDDIIGILNNNEIRVLKFDKDESGECSFEVPDMEEIEE